MDYFDWKKTIKPNIIMLKLLGLWPKDDESYGGNLYTVYAIIAVLFFQTGHTVSQIVNLYYIREDLKAVTGTIYVLLMCVSIVLKSSCVINNTEKLKKLMITINCDLFQPKNLHQKELVLPSLRAWKNIVRSFWFFAGAYSVFMALFPFLDKGYEEYRLPFFAWYPYDYKKSPYYEITYIYQIIAMNYLSLSNINTNTLIAALNMYIGAQFDIVCDDLRSLKLAHESSADVNKKLLNCVHHHREILKFADYANQFYNWLLFVEFFVDGFSIGITMFQLTVVVPFSSEFYSFLSYAVTISTQIFMYCWFGNEVEIKSEHLLYSVYECDWIELSEEVKRNMIIFILRVQKKLQISAFGLFNLSLENFMKIMRTAWSYFALLRQVSSRKLEI